MKKWLLFVCASLMLVSYAPVGQALDLGDIIDIIGVIGDDGLSSRPRPPRYPGRPDRPRPPRYGNITCTATDNGWEEHWGGHSSCRSCLKKHGDCTERCTQTYYVCTASGDDGHGRNYSADGYGDSRWEAQEEAQRNCRYDGLYGCSITRCDSEDQLVSRRSCR